MAEQIIAQGALVSELLPWQTPRPEHFPRRNRIISGLSLGTLVVEAAVKSGSLITARYALEHDREVFAIPGSIHNPMSEGCHHLIKQGAKLVAGCADIIEEIGQFGQLLQQNTIENNPMTPISKSEGVATPPLLEYIGFEPTAVDTIAERAKQSVSDVLAQILDMELAGTIAAVPGGYIRL